MGGSYWLEGRVRAGNGEKGEVRPHRNGRQLLAGGKRLSR